MQPMTELHRELRKVLIKRRVPDAEDIASTIAGLVEAQLEEAFREFESKYAVHALEERIEKTATNVLESIRLEELLIKETLELQRRLDEIQPHVDAIDNLRAVADAESSESLLKQLMGTCKLPCCQKRFIKKPNQLFCSNHCRYTFRNKYGDQ